MLLKGSFFGFGSPQQQVDIHARSKKYFHYLIICILFFSNLLNDSQTIHCSMPLLYVMLICTDWSISFKAVSAVLLCVQRRDARYTGTVKLPVFIIFQMVRYHNFVQFGISYAAVPKFTCRWQCFSNCCASGKCDTRTSEQHDGSNRLNY